MPKTHFHPWGTVTPDFWAKPASAKVPPRPAHPPRARQQSTVATVPAAFHPMVVAINAAIRAKRLDEAAASAVALEEQITAAYGAAHSHASNIRDLREYIAHLSGEHARHCQWCRGTKNT